MFRVRGISPHGHSMRERGMPSLPLPDRPQPRPRRDRTPDPAPGCPFRKVPAISRWTFRNDLRSGGGRHGGNGIVAYKSSSCVWCPGRRAPADLGRDHEPGDIARSVRWRREVNLTGAVTHVGWRAIARRLGVKDIRTAKSLVWKNHIPVIRFGKSPRLDEAIYLLWVSEFIRITAEKEGQRGPKDWAKKA